MSFRPTRLALCALALGCSSGIAVEVRPGGTLPVQAAAIYPFQFRWDEPAYRSFELSQMLALQAVATQRYAVFGPGEFRLVRATSDNPFIGSDLALGLADRGLSPLKAIVFRPSAEKRSQSAVKQVFDERGRPKGSARIEEATVLVRLEVFHSASREIVAVITGRVDLDPFAERDPSDPTPELTALLRRMMKVALSELEDRAPGQRLEREPGFAFLWNPKCAFEFAADGRPPLSEWLEKLDPLEQDVATEARLRFFFPKLDDRQLARLKGLPSGLLVTDVSGAAGEQLAQGDLVVQVNGEPALPQALQRALRATPAGAPIRLRVRRGTGLTDVALPVP